MKILYCVNEVLDYGTDTLYDGLCKVLGSENVLDYPHKESLHSGVTRGFSWYPSLFDYPIIKTDAEKIEMLKNDEFDAIFVSCINIADFRRMKKKSYRPSPIYNDFFNLLKEKSKTIPVYLIDYGDHYGINEELIKELNCKLYFKREYKKDIKYDSIVVPLNFAYSEKYVPKNVDSNRINNIFWLGKDVENRHAYIEFYSQLKDVIPNRYKRQNKYRRCLLSYKIGLSLLGRGDDTVRYYEIPAHGMLLLSERTNIIIDNDFKDGETAVFFSNLDELKEKLNYCINNPEYVDKIAKAGREHFLKYHTSTIRAQQLLDKIK